MAAPILQIHPVPSVHLKGEDIAHGKPGQRCHVRARPGLHQCPGRPRVHRDLQGDRHHQLRAGRSRHPRRLPRLHHRGPAGTPAVLRIPDRARVHVRRRCASRADRARASARPPLPCRRDRDPRCRARHPGDTPRHLRNQRQERSRSRGRGRRAHPGREHRGVRPDHHRGHSGRDRRPRSTRRSPPFRASRSSGSPSSPSARAVFSPDSPG